ncbi:MAG: hypothetical protein AABX98_05680 [Nanoarchaeota archaeon]
MTLRINTLQYLFHLYTLNAPSLEVVVGPKADLLSKINGIERYLSFPRGMASPRYVVSYPRKPEVYSTDLVERKTKLFIDDLMSEAVDRNYTLVACSKLFPKIVRDKNNLRADRGMHRIFTQHPEIASWFPAEFFFWKLLEMSKGKKVYETIFEAPEECKEAAARYALHAARIICEQQQGVLYDEKQDKIGILRREETPKRELVCVSPSSSVVAERDRWDWISCQR